MLREVYISPKLRKEIDKQYLDFLVGLFISACKLGNTVFTRDKKQWFLEEILIHIKTVWPEMPHDQCKTILMSIVDMAYDPKATHFDNVVKKYIKEAE